MMRWCCSSRIASTSGTISAMRNRQMRFGMCRTWIMITVRPNPRRSPLPERPCPTPKASPIATPASTSTRATSSWSASSPMSAARCVPRCSRASAVSAPSWGCPRATRSRCSSPAPTASARSCASPSTRIATTTSASISSRCASTTSRCRVRSRCSSSTTTPPASSMSPWRRKWSPASRAAAPSRVARSSAARPPRCPACITRATTIWPASASASWSAAASSTARRSRRATSSSAWPPRVRIPTAIR